MYCKCGNRIPDVRENLGYTSCVECSTEEKWGCAQVVYHKTGNTIEVIKDKELCEQINAMAERTSFGVCRGMTGNYKKKSTNKSVQKRKQRTKKPTFDEIGFNAMNINEKEGVMNASKYLDECLKKKFISTYQYNKIQSIIFSLNNNLSWTE